MTEPGRDDVWSIGVDGWIIQDGNYPDFATSQESDFGVELIPHTISRTGSQGRPGSSLIAGAFYEFVGTVVVEVAGGWVVDIGLLVYGHSDDLDGPSVGDTVSGTAYLSISGPGVFDQAFIDAAPPHLYRWHINGIQRETTPWLETNRGRLRDVSRTSFVDVEHTNAWEDDVKHGPHYVLRCTPLSGPR